MNNIHIHDLKFYSLKINIQYIFLFRKYKTYLAIFKKTRKGQLSACFVASTNTSTFHFIPLHYNVPE